jgi:hypothetical protein
MSAPSPDYGAPSLGPADRNPRLITPPDGPAWDDPAPAAWRAFGEPLDPDTQEGEA